MEKKKLLSNDAKFIFLVILSILSFFIVYTFIFLIFFITFDRSRITASQQALIINADYCNTECARLRTQHNHIFAFMFELYFDV